LWRFIGRLIVGSLLGVTTRPAATIVGRTLEEGGLRPVPLLVDAVDFALAHFACGLRLAGFGLDGRWRRRFLAPWLIGLLLVVVVPPLLVALVAVAPIVPAWPEAVAPVVVAAVLLIVAIALLVVAIALLVVATIRAWVEGIGLLARVAAGKSLPFGP